MTENTCRKQAEDIVQDLDRGYSERSTEQALTRIAYLDNFRNHGKSFPPLVATLWHHLMADATYENGNYMRAVGNHLKARQLLATLWAASAADLKQFNLPQRILRQARALQAQTGDTDADLQELAANFPV